MAIGHPAYFDSTPGNIQPDDRHYEHLIQPQVKQIVPPPLKVPYLEAPRGHFAVAAFNPYKVGHHHNAIYGAHYDISYDEEDEFTGPDPFKKNYYAQHEYPGRQKAYLAIREDYWPVANEQVVIVPAQPVTPDIYRQLVLKQTSPSLAGSAPTTGVYTGIGSGNSSGYTPNGYEP